MILFIGTNSNQLKTKLQWLSRLKITTQNNKHFHGSVLFFGCLFFDPALLEAEKTGKIRWYFGKGDNSYPFLKCLTYVSRFTRLFGFFQNPGNFAFGVCNPKLRNLESKFQWQKIQYLESRIHSVEYRIQDCLELYTLHGAKLLIHYVLLVC